MVAENGHGPRFIIQKRRMALAHISHLYFRFIDQENTLLIPFMHHVRVIAPFPRGKVMRCSRTIQYCRHARRLDHVKAYPQEDATMKATNEIAEGHMRGVPSELIYRVSSK
jgi:hypothetical protein